MKNKWQAVFTAAVLVCFGVTFYSGIEEREAFSAMPVSGKIIVIDPGHGGWDPGKSGLSGDDEKDINLSIAVRVKEYLETGGAEVYLTRQTDEALGKSKAEDMKKRTADARRGEADIFVSIHQNAFTSASPKGAQVFYYKGSDGGKSLADCIQNRLVSFSDPDNKRMAKQNNDYYILKNTDVAAVIVECGFLSNPTEEKKLNNTAYQDSIAWAIYMGIWDYFDTGNFT